MTATDMGIILPLLFSVSSTVLWHFAIRKIGTIPLALLGAASGIAEVYAVEYTVAGHPDKFFLLSVIPVAGLALVASAMTAFVLSARLR